MSGHCPQDGGFVGDAGCTHPNHRHSELVRGLVANASPRGRLSLIPAADAEAALREGFYVDGPGGARVGFGRNLLAHIEEDTAHAPEDIRARKERLMYAVSTVMAPDRVEENHRSIPGRKAYAKAFDGFGILAVSEPNGEDIERVFTYFPRRGMKRRAK